MTMTAENPYSSPLSEYGESSPRRSPMNRVAMLPVTPWRLREVSELCPNHTACLFGYAVLSIQIGLAISPEIGSIAEPYADVAACIAESVEPLFFCIGFGAILAILPSLVAFATDRTAAKTLMLASWASSLLFVPWLICHFCLVLNRPSYGIVNDDRAGWMTHPAVLAYGSYLFWFATLMVIVAASALRGRTR